MNRKKITCLLAALCLAIQLQGCASTQAPATQPPTNGAGENSGQNQAGPLDLTPELTLNQNMVIGKTTLDEMIKKYGLPKLRKTKSDFKTDVAKQGLNGPAIEELRAPFKVNPLTGEKTNDTFSMYFTADAKPVFVSAPVLLKRDDLLKKVENESLTLDDIKKVYGKPTREVENDLEYYDFDHKIVLVVSKRSNGNIAARVTKYDLLYGKNQQDMKAFEELIKKAPPAPAEAGKK